VSALRISLPANGMCGDFLAPQSDHPSSIHERHS
jgi:hypothetical protein